MSKLFEYYKRLAKLRDELKIFAEDPIDGADIEGAAIRLHACHVVYHLDKRIESARDSMSLKEASWFDQ